ncbi:MAG: ABC transporter ATP-binding protein [Myxococcota bacterium]
MRVELRGVDKRFGRLMALRDVDLEFESGRGVALVGPNGSGKSTLQRIVMGLVAPTRGEALLDDRPPDRARVGRAIGYVPQLAPTLAAPVGELIRAFCRVREVPRDEVRSALVELDLDPDEVWRKPFRELSGGMKQKVLVALAVMPGTRLLVMDEPTASLDAESRERFFQLVRERRGDATLVLSSHRLEEIRHLVDHVVALREGEVAWHGSAEGYLGQRGRSIIELREAGESDAEWFREHGFRPGAAGWWTKTVRRSEKVEALREVSDRLNGRLEDVVVRDMERVEPVEQAGAGDG